MIKRAALLTLIFIVFITFCSCTPPEIRLDINEGFFNISAYLPDDFTSSGSNIFRYSYKGINISLYISDKNDKADYFQTISSGFKKRTAYGIKYYYRTDEVCWDATDGSSGTTSSKDILFYLDEYFVSLSAYTEERNISDVSLKLALDLLSMKNINGLTMTSSDLYATFTNDTINGTIRLIAEEDPVYNYEYYRNKVNQEEDGIRYFANSFDYPQTGYLICNTDNGILKINYSIPGGDNIPTDDLDFINFTFAKNIAKELGVKIISFDSLLSP